MENINNNILGKNSLEKHYKYEKTYKTNETYWGIGIENELYLEFDNYINFEKYKFLNNHKRERYSVDYYTNYKTEYIDDIFNLVAKTYDGKLPLLFNSHSMTRTDKFNNSKTLYTKLCEPNPNFEGETLWEFISKNNSYLKDNFDKSFTFDGDTFEIITLNFYKATVDNVIDEYKKHKFELITNLQNIFNQYDIFTDYGKIGFMKKNHPFAVHLTNLNNVGIFNNGTIHFNITLPTILDTNGLITNKDKFVDIHKNYIKLIQFFEPFFLSIYGSPDPFSSVKQNSYDKSELFSSCSQRGAVSRYIGIGTYNTDYMKTGKLLFDNIDTFEIYNNEFGWYKQYYKNCAYNQLDSLGYDINFNKHYNHGVEIRFFDHITDDETIKEILGYLIVLADYSLVYTISSNPILSVNWNNLIVKCMKYGVNTFLDDSELDMYNQIFNHKFTNTNISKLFYEIIDFINIPSYFSKLTMANSKNIISNIIDEIITTVENNVNIIKITDNNDIIIYLPPKINNIKKKNVSFENSTNLMVRRNNIRYESKCCSVL
jgi:hypothetical protein